jgi:hypothetical protein
MKKYHHAIKTEALQCLRRGRFLVNIFAVVVLSACGGGAGSASGAATPPSTTSMNAASAVAQLESAGVIPVLNRDATVAGVVTNSNVIRDDINTYIAGLPDSQVQKKALIQLAAAYQRVLLVDTTNSSAVQTADTSLLNAISCIHNQYDSQTFTQKTLMLEKLTVNTKVRFTAYEYFNSATTGYVTTLPAKGYGCGI